MAADYDTIRYEVVDDAIAIVTMARPEARNAQSTKMISELDDAFMAACHDDAIKVILLAGDDPHFSAGHDLRDAARFDFEPKLPVSGGYAKRRPAGDKDVLGRTTEAYMAFEEEIYFGMCARWRDLPKPTIAQVQGKCIAGGLMVAWVCDLIVCSDDASFQDVTLQFGVNGPEYFAHPYEVGHRKAKEMLFTGEAIPADVALRLGMVNHVVPRDELATFTLDLARKIARQDSFALRLAKRVVNQSLDLQGFTNLQQSTVTTHHLGHAVHFERMRGGGASADPLDSRRQRE